VKHQRRGKARFGRVTFTNITDEKWFKIFWSDGSTSTHDSRFLVRLEILPEDEAPVDLMHRPEPVVIMVTKQAAWSLQTTQDIKSRLCLAMPGNHDEASIEVIFRSLSAKVRKAMTEQTPTRYLDMLNSTLHLDACRVILDPWAGNKAIQKGLKCDNANLCLNDKLGREGVHIKMEPLEAMLYHRVINTFGELNAIVMIPPVALCDLAFVNALEFASQVVCMLVSDVWYVCAHPSRAALLNRMEREGRLLVICDVEPTCHMYWICVFASTSERSRLLLDYDNHDMLRMIMKRVNV
jgi:hypothetical protein